MRMMRERRPSAVVLDLTLPEIDAFRFLEVMKSDDDLSRIPVIIVSGRAVSVAEHEMITSTACAYFTKGDFSPRQIAQTLKMAIAA